MTSRVVKGALATCVALLAACGEAPVAAPPATDAARDVGADPDATPDASTDALPTDVTVTDVTVTDVRVDGSADGSAADAGLDASTTDASDDAALPSPRDASLRIAAPTTADASTGDASSPAPAIGTDGLVAWYPLDGDFRDAQGAHPLTADGAPAFTDEAYPRVGRAYGPTGRSSANGASDATFTSVDLARGVTLEGWVRGRDNNAVGLLFGWGQVGDGAPTLSLLDSYGFLAVRIGRDYRNVFVGNFDRVLGDACWHHVALVLPPGALDGAPFQLYVDGVAATLDSQNRASPGVPMGTLAVRNTVDNVLGSPFHVGAFGGPQGGTRQVDEVRVWSRALTADEVRREAAPVARSRRCLPPLPPAWAPGPLCAPQDATVEVDLGVRVLTDDTVAIVTDPNPWMTRLLRADCGRFLDAVDAQGGSLLGWEVARYYDEAALNTQARVRPVLLDALLTPGWFAVSRDGAAASSTVVAAWPQPTREWVLPTSVTGREPVRTTAAEVVYYSYLHLAERLVPGGHYVVDDGTGARVAFTYDPARTVSWALQVDQLGYAVDAPKYAYLGAWMGPAGALDLRRFEGAPFRVARERDDAAVFSGVIRHRAEPTTWGADRQPVTGAQVFEMNFTALTAPGRYRVEVPGAGRSWAFTVGDDALGEAFYTHARALYHARCGTEIAASVTPWHRGDAHGTTRRGAAPGEPDDYTDHAADGWGFRAASGAWASHNEFEMVARTATDTVLAGVSGGWHDAADFDRASWHLTAHDDLAHAYLFYPTHFTDGQLGIPESGNGVPDLLDEAVWGIDVFRRGQEADGRTSIHVEATSHPRVSDAAVDAQPYYLGLATRKSSLAYAARAALMARALARAGDTARSALYLTSAQRAWAFGTGPTRVTLAVPGTTETWSEPATPPPERVLSAAVQLWLATGDTAVRAVLDRADIDAAFRREAAAPLLSPYELLDVALAPDRFPAAWGPLARASVIAGADLFVDAQNSEPYRKLWYPPTHGYFWTLGWGQGHFQTARFAMGAYLLTGDARYRDAAYLAVNWEQGANPQGRVQTTGLGANGVLAVLHLPSFVDDLDEPVPGLTPFGYGASLPWNARTRAWGLFADAEPATGFEPIASALLPPPWRDAALTPTRIGELLYAAVPVFRRYVPLEAQNPATAEMDVRGMANAAAITGMLLGPGWTPSPALRARRPRTAAELRDAWWSFP